MKSESNSSNGYRLTVPKHIFEMLERMRKAYVDRNHDSKRIKDFIDKFKSTAIYYNNDEEMDKMYIKY